MARKPKPRELTKAEAYCVESNYGKLPAEKIAEQFGLPLESVSLYIEQLAEAGVKPQPATSQIEKAGYAVHKGEGRGSQSVSMTQLAAELADEERGVTFEGQGGKKKNKEFFERRVPNNIHIIDPGQPTH
jgi:hypothetical protein